MTFTLVWMRGQLAVGAIRFDELVEATAYAEDNLERVSTKFGATAVKVVSHDGTPQYLRALSR